MALAQRYVNEVLNQFESTVVLNETEWPELVKALKFEDRDLSTLVIGRMQLRMARGGYEGLMKDLAALLKENEELRQKIGATQTAKAPKPELVHA